MILKNPLVFAVHATSRGFGYVLFEGPFAPYDWGIVGARGDKNATCLRRLERLLDRHAPATLLLEAFGKRSSVRSHRIERLYRGLSSLAVNRSIEVLVYNHRDIQACFASVGARTRQEIAEAVGRHIAAFHHQLPSPRQAWQTSDSRMAMFSAAALVLTHYQLGASGLFDQLA
jgi:hypothetical protein